MTLEMNLFSFFFFLWGGVVVGLYKSTIKEASRVQVKGGQFLNNRAAYFGVAPFSIRGGVFKYDLSLIGCPS